ncbi:MAG: hypothetical protein AAGA66_14910, partial [Bacteroidota bacterium]
MKTKTIQRFIYLLFAFTFILISCDDEENNQAIEEDVQLSDANAVSESITVPGAEVESGDPPEPSQDPEAPELSGEDVDALSVQGGELFIDLELLSGDVAGIYLQIPGADSYFDIPASAFLGGRVADDDGPAFSLELPDNIEPGEFCADVCVYDSDERVSNVIEVCVTVSELGGENSDFLIGTWNITQFVDEFDGEVDTRVVGVLDIDSLDFPFLCEGGQETKDVTVEVSEKTNFVKVTFSGNGALKIEESREEKYVDFESSTCEDVQFKEKEDDSVAEGGWSYDNDTDQLILIANFIDEETDEREETVIDLTITITDSTMVGVQ